MNDSVDFDIQVKNIYKFYGNIKALKNMSFNVKKGEIIGLLGPNGVRKTTIFLLMNVYENKIVDL